VSKFVPRGMGWIPDLPDPRDFTPEHPQVSPLLRKLNAPETVFPERIDLRCGEEGEHFLTDVEDQGRIDCSSAHAVLSLLQYFERRIHGREFARSSFFLYKVTRNLRNKQNRVSGDTGADLRTTWKALSRFGVPAQELWPEDAVGFDDEPNAFVYQAAKKISGLRYFRLDPSGSPFGGVPMGEGQGEIVQAFLAAGFPVAFGFSVPSSINAGAVIPYRPFYERYLGGQVALAIGFDRHYFGRERAAILVRSSWGKHWGADGNGWMPVSYIQSGLAKDFWTVVSDDIVQSNEVTRPRGLV